MARGQAAVPVLKSNMIICASANAASFDTAGAGDGWRATPKPRLLPFRSVASTISGLSIPRAPLAHHAPGGATVGIGVEIKVFDAHEV
jgi:hypothetical protein